MIPGQGQTIKGGLTRLFSRMALACTLALTAIQPVSARPAFETAVRTTDADAYLIPAAVKRGAYAPPRASLVMDFTTGQILKSSNPDAPRHPASLTKVMTMMLVFDALRDGRIAAGERLPVSAHAAQRPPVKLGLKAGDAIPVEDALALAATRSMNDVAVILAEAVAGSETAFAALMNEKARQLGMNATTFTNASGLPDRAQITTARDMATMTRFLIENYPVEYDTYFGRRSVAYNGQTFSATNKLLSRYRGMDGVKTGYIYDSGYNLIAAAEQNGRRIIGVVFGGPTAAARDNEMVRLLNDGFKLRPPIGPLPRPVPRPVPPQAAPVMGPQP